jgi:hypothetical protein
VLGIVYRTISAYILKEARLPRASGATGAVTLILIQRFGSALNLNIHFHMLVCGFRRCRSVIPIQAGHRSGRCRSRFDAVDKTIRENRSSVNAAWLWVRP